jgi:hypothetical protein
MDFYWYIIDQQTVAIYQRIIRERAAVIW